MLFVSRFVNKIETQQVNNEKYYFRGICSAETRKHTEYTVQIGFDSVKRQITKARCTCCNGSGFSAACKHISAIAHCVEYYVISGTYKNPFKRT